MSSASRLLLLLVALVTATGAGPADLSAVTELRNLTERLSRLDRYDIDITIQIHSPRETAPVRNLKAIARKAHERELRSFEHLLLLSSPDALMMIDHQRREIHYRRAGEAAPIDTELPSPTKTLELVRSQAVGVDVATSDEGRVFTVSDTTGTIAKVIFDPSTGYLRRVIYPERTNSTKGRVVVEYHWRDPAALKDEELLEQRFVVKRGDALEPGPAVPGYRLIEVQAAR